MAPVRTRLRKLCIDSRTDLARNGRCPFGTYAQRQPTDQEERVIVGLSKVCNTPRRRRADERQPEHRASADASKSRWCDTDDRENRSIHVERLAQDCRIG